MKAIRRRKYWVAPAIFAALVISLSVTLLTIGARSPYTHSNLTPGVVSGYSRTSQTLVGEVQPMDRASMAGQAHGNLTEQGAELFMTLNCAACHGAQGQGGVFAPVIAGVNATLLKQKTTSGPAAMPKFSGLTDNDINALAAYLASVTKTTGSSH